MKRKIYIFLLSSCLFISPTFSQEDSGDNIKKEKKNAIAVSFGVPGFGIEYARKISPKISAKVVWHSYTLKDYEQNDIELDGETINALINFKSSVYDIGFEWTPSLNSSFKFIAGLGIFSDFSLNGVATYTEDITVGNVTVTKQDVGEITAETTWSGAAPYVGLGFGRAVPKRRLGFGIELGTYISNSPDVNLQASKLLAPTANQEDTLREALSDLKFIPRILFRLSYKF
ncbi:hypothetical protein [Polaribacter aquimarinus]|uniref:Outer membrane protein beta-barrel domain-containing protein n=1 Tax=Polaribacter aquimarinus TaxID=2100726 RepID=A0A2U2JAB5_9FLAO|nr:hypothetical protein [Polaribacter aquimarinus]PWG05265.1 hypothetical protein DIS07_08490 [Polaribacter aquimarinus]